MKEFRAFHETPLHGLVVMPRDKRYGAVPQMGAGWLAGCLGGSVCGYVWMTVSRTVGMRVRGERRGDPVRRGTTVGDVDPPTDEVEDGSDG